MDDRTIYFSQKLKENLSKNIKELVLFGSRARGDYWDGSDYDFLIVVNEKSKETIKSIRQIEVDFLDKFDILSASLIFDEEEWEKTKKLPIGINILREGEWI
ncbi:MAG: hypothetical protein A2086_06865 [Spirochaetes bacterium GWD1_27_9]|nr:MAG: hypothetical protein A2Z98_18655 [Spirochaetes bacterium GWB1_27_13]OHD20242.1 MAG: hypothetical protein A2Y34_04895 [Spirochaetes bacterium GWC1_27_15]OHD42616.1 MAG: hypothetical protein A2086_06865 [Spirochaetes bacterium GWD1_27_9]